jgi:glucokinase
MILAADVGGTKTLMGLFRPQGLRPAPVATRVYATLDFGNLGETVRVFLDYVGKPRIEAICAGVAGPVKDLYAELTNAPWSADLEAIASDLGGCRAALLNDLESMAYSVSVLESEEILVLQAGEANPHGNAALIAAGTGLNASHIQYVDGRLIPSPSETGHADFAARTDRELALVEMLTRATGRADIESVVSGPGIVNLFRFTHEDHARRPSCPVVAAGVDDRDVAAEVTATALAEKCPLCVDALEMFVSAYGAETGNVALRSMATGGMYVGGGIAPKILPALQKGPFMAAFRAKGPMAPLLAKMPVKVILNPSAALVGASVRAASLLHSFQHTR